MHKRILVTGLVIIASVTGCAKIVVEAVRPNMGGAGVFYALPKTVIHVALKADMTTLKAAPYQKFAPIFAPGGAVACDSAAKCKPPKPKGTSPLTILTEDIVPPDAGPDTKTTYSLQRGATFTTSGVPDSEHVYLVKFTGNSTVDQALAMTWTETGRGVRAAIGGIAHDLSVGHAPALSAVCEARRMHRRGPGSRT